MTAEEPLYLQIEIDENAIEQSALRILEILRPSWPKQRVMFKKFDEGIMNVLIGCYLDGEFNEDVVLVRMYGKNTEMTMDRIAEKEIMRFLSEKGFCQPLYAVLPNGIAYKFEHGKTLDMDTVRNEHIRKLIAKEMAKLHSINPSIDNPKSGLFKKLDDWYKIVPEKYEDPKLQKRFLACFKPKSVLLEEKERLRQELDAMDCPIVLSHNDLLLKNIIYNKDEDKLTFIDYEFAMYNYQAYDIGNHFCEYAGIDEIDYDRYPDKSYQINWIRNYLNCWKEQNGDHTEVTDRDLEKLYVQANKCALAAHFFCGTWALIQAKYATIDFDYFEYARIRFEEYFNKRDEFLSLKY